MKVLVVDNDRTSLKETVYLIKLCGKDYEISAFEDTIKAMEAINKVTFDIAFIEINLFGLSGITLAKKLKEQNISVNVIFTSTCADFAIEALNMKASGYLLKPLTYKDVLHELNELRF